MKKVLIMTSGLAHGGVNRSLLNYLKVMSETEYEHEVFSLYSYGPYLKLFKGYNLLTMFDLFRPLNCLRPYISKETKLASSIRRICDFGVKVFFHMFHARTASIIAATLSKRNYDIVISFQEGFTTEIISFVNANKKIAWVHCDYSRYIEATHRDEIAIYSRYSWIVCVSEYTASVLRTMLPAIKDRVVAIHNIMDDEGIKALSLSGIKLTYYDNAFNLVSIGRLDPVKRFSYIPSIAKKLKDEGIKFEWYIIGDGGVEKETIINGIKENSVEDSVVLLGELDNPYPYIRNAALLVCLSSSEACPNVINEAKILHRPVVTTDFPSVNEYILDGVNGYIRSIEKVHSIISELYFNKDKYNNLLKNIDSYEYDNEAIIQKIESMF